MSASWQALAARIDALSLRERAFLFLSVVAVCVALADTLWLAPARDAHTRLKTQFAQDNLESQRLRDELNTKAAQPDPSRQVRDEIALRKADLAAVNAAISAQAGSSTAGPTLEVVLTQFLRRHSGLALVRVTNLGTPESGVAPVAGAAAAAAPGVAAALPVGISRRGLELTVAGPYAELVRYVQTLERAMPELRWGPFALAAEQQPPQLRLQVFLVGGQP